MVNGSKVRSTGWRWNLLHCFGPGGYPGFLLSDWLRLLRDNQFSVSPKYLVRAASATASSFTNTAIAAFERARFGADIDKMSVSAPLFILGHWRSGTTLLHQLIALDEQFAFPNLYQVTCPHTFLSSESSSTRLTRFLLPRIRPFDNVRQTWDMPYEDEIANAMLSQRSPYLCGLFPKRTEYYDRYLTFADVPAHETDEWRAGLLHFLKKLTWKYQRPLVLKSPPHTCRIRLLLGLFPDAKFVHIHRNPYAVFQSTMHLIDQGLKLTCFQRPDPVDWEIRTLRVYREMYDIFFDERSLIPRGHLCQVAFEDLAHDPVRQVRKIYETLSLPGIDHVESRLLDYVMSNTGYRKNSFAELAAAQRKRVASEWRRSFEEWHYPVIRGGNG